MRNNSASVESYFYSWYLIYNRSSRALEDKEELRNLLLVDAHNNVIAFCIPSS